MTTFLAAAHSLHWYDLLGIVAACVVWVGLVDAKFPRKEFRGIRYSRT
ncbi:MAG: hypothetical protein P4L84_11245 [Isosphaeraceae bacterium]|nr:hypothetical protein [Isosphaeraceae bacterium]